MSLTWRPVAVSWRVRSTAVLEGLQAPQAGASCSDCPGWGSCCWGRRHCCYSCWWRSRRRLWTPRILENANPAEQVNTRRRDPEFIAFFQRSGYKCTASFSWTSCEQILTRSSLTTVSSSSSFPLSQGWKYLKPWNRNIIIYKTSFDRINEPIPVH